MKNLIILTLLLFLASCASAPTVAKADSPKARFVFSDKNGLYGLLDENGNEIVPAQYLYIDIVKDGMIPAFTTEKEFIFLDETGKKIKDISFYDINPFYTQDLLVVVDSKTEKCGFIDKNLNYVIEPQFDDVGRFIDGIAAVQQNGFWGMIDKTGKYIIEPQFEDIGGGFIDGIALAKQKGLWGVIDKTGKYIIEPQFDDPKIYFPYYYIHGTLAVLKAGKIRLVDVKKAKILDAEYDEFYGIIGHKVIVGKDSSLYMNSWENNEIFLMKKPNGTVSHIYNNNLMGNDRFYIEYFEKGEKKYYQHFAVFDSSSGEKICDKILENELPESLDENCNVKEKPYYDKKAVEENEQKKYSKYEEVRHSMCSEEHSTSFKQNGKWGFLDEDGNVVIPAEYDSVSAFYVDVAWVRKGDRRFIIDRSNRIVVEIKPEWRSLDELRYVEPICYGWGLYSILREDYWYGREKVEKIIERNSSKSSNEQNEKH